MIIAKKPDDWQLVQQSAICYFTTFRQLAETEYLNEEKGLPINH
ncbi:hypothetical protein [Virgibacillus senegalensis]|nr:hypothetical protein [Virgibacillus senegalensis]